MRGREGELDRCCQYHLNSSIDVTSNKTDWADVIALAFESCQKHLSILEWLLAHPVSIFIQVHLVSEDDKYLSKRICTRASLYPVIVGSSYTNLELEKKKSYTYCDHFDVQCYSLYYRHAIFPNFKVFWFYIYIKIILGLAACRPKLSIFFQSKRQCGTIKC